MANTTERTDLKELGESPVYETIESVLFWLKKLDAGEEIGEEQLGKLKEATGKVLESRGWKKEVDISDKKQRRDVLVFLERIDENEAGEEEATTETTEEEVVEMGSKSLTSKELAVLVAEYEAAVRAGELRELAAERFQEATGFNIEGFLSHEKELYRKSLEVMEGEEVSMKKLNEVAREITAEKFVLTDELEKAGIENAPILAEKVTVEAIGIMTEGKVDIEKIRKKIRRRLKGVEAGKRVEMVERIIEKVATARVKIEGSKVVKKMVEELMGAGVRVEKEKLEKVVENIMIESWRNNVSLSDSNLVEEVSKINGGEIPQEMATIIRKAELKKKVARETNKRVFEIEEGRVLKEKIVTAVIATKGNEGVNRKQAVFYARFIVNGFYRNNPATGLRDEMRATVSEEGFRKGRTVDEVFRETKALWGLLQQGGIKEKIAMFKRFSETLKLSGADEIGACRAANGIMKILSKNPRMVKTLEMARKVIRIEESMGNWQGKALMWIGRRIGSEGIQKIGSEMVGGVVMREVVRNSMIIIGKQGLTQGTNIIGSSLISGGSAKLAEVAVSLMAKKGAGGLVAKGAVWLAGVLGGVSGPPGWVVAAVVWVGSKVLGAVKKGITKVREGLEKAGIYIPVATQIQRLFSWAGRQFKKLPIVGEFLSNIVVGAGDFLYALGGIMMATMTVAVAPVIIGLFLFLTILLPTISSPMISSLVGPVNMGGGVGAEVEENLPDLVAEAVTCDGGGEASVRSKVMEGIKQNQGSWANKGLPKGCTFADSGCGPTAVAGVLMKKDGNLTPYNLVFEDGSPYKDMGCKGSSLKQAEESLEKHSSEKVRYNAVTKSCDKKDIADWICKGKVVMVLANFYKNKELEIGGHFFLAVEVKNGEVHTVDPFYDDGAVMDGTKKYGYVQAIRECIVISVD